MLLQGNDVLRLGSFLSIGYIELNFLAVGQSFEAIALDRAEVYEYIWAVFTLDKAESFRFVKPFNGSGCLRHSVYLYTYRAMSRRFFE